MTNFNYKQVFVNVNIDITKEMISYKGKTIPSQDIIGIGLGFTDIAKVAVGQALGGMIGGAIAANGYNGKPILNKNLSEMPKSRFAQMMITYNKDGKQKFIRVPLTTMDETCIKMVHEAVKIYPSKFVGFGSLKTVEKELKISEFWAAIIVISIITIAAIATIVGAAPQQ